jgi:tryptophanyl-tRNA synthetase
VLQELGGAQFSTFKATLIERLVAELGPIREQTKRLLQDPAHIEAVLADGAQRAQVLAAETMRGVKDIVGLVRPK